jgi:catalase
MINSNNKRVYVRFHWLSQQGCCGLTGPDAKLLAGEDPNFLSKDLRDAIANNQLPRWKLAFQVMSEEQAQTCLEAFDPTKVWKHSEYPLVDIGTLELNRLPMDYHSEVEQVAFSPSNVVPGISFSPDKLLQSRLFIYPDTQNHRLGPNYQMIPVNRPLKTQFKNMGYVGGAHNTETGSKFPHYFPSSLGGQSENPIAGEPPIHTDGDASWYQPPALGMPDDFYGQAKSFYLKAIDDKQRMAIADNIAESLSKGTKFTMNSWSTNHCQCLTVCRSFSHLTCFSLL